MSKKNKEFTKPVQIKEEPAKVEVKEETTEKDAVIYGVNNMLNIRSTPEQTPDNIIGMFPNGTKLKVVDHSNPNWYRIVITDPKHVEGYAMKKYIKIV